MLQVHIAHSPSAHWSSSHPQTLCYNPLVLSQQLNLPPVSYRILLSCIYNLNTTGAAWHNVSKIDRYILFEIPVTLAPLNFAFQPISRLIHHACQVCLFNPLKDTVGLHYTISRLPKCFAPQFFFCATILVWMDCVGCRCGWLGDVGCAAELQIGSPRLMSRATGFCEVIDMQITRVRARIFPGGVASRRSVNTIMEMCRGFFGSHCLSWITRQSNEPVSTATVTEWGVCIVTHCITAYGRREKESTSDQSFPLPSPVYSIYQRKHVQTHFASHFLLSLLFLSVKVSVCQV